MTSTVALVALFSSAPHAHERSLDIEPGTPIRIVSSGAQVEVREGAPGQVRARAALKRSLDGLRTKLCCGTAQILLQPLAEGQLVYGRLEVVVPPGSAVEIVARSGRVDVEGVRSPIRVTSGQADVFIAGAGPEIRARTVSGDLVVDGAQVTTVELESVRGDIRFTGRLSPGAKTFVESLTGRVEFAKARLGEPQLAVMASE